jgi:site-specific DNA recombinase
MTRAEASRKRCAIYTRKSSEEGMGGNVPLGYDASERTLVINPAEAETVRRIFAPYRELGCVRRVKEEADRLGFRAKCRTTAMALSAAANPSRAVISTHCSQTQFTPAG